jgi:hypothetical protein
VRVVGCCAQTRFERVRGPSARNRRRAPIQGIGKIAKNGTRGTSRLCPGATVGRTREDSRGVNRGERGKNQYR